MSNLFSKLKKKKEPTLLEAYRMALSGKKPFKGTKVDDALSDKIADHAGAYSEFVGGWPDEYYKFEQEISRLADPKESSSVLATTRPYNVKYHGQDLGTELAPSPKLAKRAALKEHPEIRAADKRAMWGAVATEAQGPMPKKYNKTLDNDQLLLNGVTKVGEAFDERKKQRDYWRNVYLRNLAQYMIPERTADRAYAARVFHESADHIKSTDRKKKISDKWRADFLPSAEAIESDPMMYTESPNPIVKKIVNKLISGED